MRWASVFVTGIVVVAGLSGGFAVAAEKATAEELAEWKTLAARKAELIEQLTKLQMSFPKAETDEEREKIRLAFTSAREEFQTKVYPRLTDLAERVYAAEPENLDAAETVLENAFSSNRYDEAVKVGDQLLAAGRKSIVTQNVTGVAHFAVHDFAGAKKILTEAEEAGSLHPQLGARYLAECEPYEEFWKTEQAIRAKEEKATGDEQLPRVEFDTTKGKIVIELFENEAPNTVANFISLVEGKKYDKTKFHRVIPNFMAQGGDPNSVDDDPSDDGTGGPGYVIPCECYEKNARKHFRGSLSMAHAGQDTGGSQFFITHLPTSHLNADKEAGRGHTVFGRVVTGLDVAAALEVGDVIQAAKVTRKRNHPYKPMTQPDERVKF